MTETRDGLRTGEQDRSRPAGTAIERGGAGFEQAVLGRGFNALAPEGRPERIVFPQDEAQVADAVRQALATGQRVAVRSGGHSWVSASVQDDGVLIDLGALDGIELDRTNRRAVVGPAVRGAQLSPLLEVAGLAFPVGHCGTPALGGFLLGGGLGLNWGAWKPACLSITRMRIVTADGDVVTASAEENPDLFWFARGGGPTFPGIVTEFELALQPLPRAIRIDTWLFPLTELDAVARWIDEASPALPPNVELSLVTQGPGRPGGPEAPTASGAVGGTAAAHPLVLGVAATVFADDEAGAASALAPLGDGPRAHDDGTPVTVLEHVAGLPGRFSTLHEPVDATYPEGARYLADTFFSHGGLTEATAALAALMERAPSGKSYVLAGMPANGDAATLLTPGDAAYGMHDTSLLIVYVIWDDPADDAANRAWLDEVATALLPTATGHFLSEADIRNHPERVAGSFRPADWRRIRRLRTELDPTGVFHTFPLPHEETATVMVE
ncbi:MAG: FAD-binding oxidoreductase [Herbiconiux sp.]|nr:FAD-binding oxidoreductase [Herbiconiux sp.]